MARRGICQPRLWLDVAWHGLMPVDVGSVWLPQFVSSANLQRARMRAGNSLLALGHGDPGTTDDGEPDVQPRGPEVALPADTST